MALRLVVEAFEDDANGNEGKRNIMGSPWRLGNHRRIDGTGRMYMWNIPYCSQQTWDICPASNIHITLGEGLMIASAGWGNLVVDHLAWDAFENEKEFLNLKT